MDIQSESSIFQEAINRHERWLTELRLNSLVYVGGCYYTHRGIYLVRQLTDLVVTLTDGRTFNRTGLEAGARVDRLANGWIANPTLHHVEIDELLIKVGLAISVKPNNMRSL